MYACYDPKAKNDTSYIDFIFGKVGYHTFLKYERVFDVLGVEHWFTNGYFINKRIINSHRTPGR